MLHIIDKYPGYHVSSAKVEIQLADQFRDVLNRRFITLVRWCDVNGIECTPTENSSIFVRSQDSAKVTAYLDSEGFTASHTVNLSEKR